MARAELDTAVRYVRRITATEESTNLSDGHLLETLLSVSPKVAAHLQGMARTAALCQFKGAAIVVLCAAAVTAGLGLAAAQGIPDGQASAIQISEKNDVAQSALQTNDADGQPLPAGAVARLGTRRFRLAGGADFGLPTPDGKYFLVHPKPRISGSPPNGLMLMDADTGLIVRRFEDGYRVAKRGSSESFRPTIFSPDGKKLYGVAWDKSEEAGNGMHVWDSFDRPSKRVLLTWDVGTGKLLAEWPLPAGQVHGANLIGVNLSADGERLYIYGAVRIGNWVDRTIRGVPGIHVFDVATGNYLTTWEGVGFPVGTIAGGKELLTFNKDSIVSLDAHTGKPARTFLVTGYVPCVVLEPKRELLAAIDVVVGKGPKQCEIRLWEAATGREIRRLSVDPKAAGHWSRLAFSHDSKTLYLGGDSGRILRWNLSDGAPLPGWQAHYGIVAELFPRPGTEEFVSLGRSDGAVRRWDATTGRSLSPKDAYLGDVAVARTPDGNGMVIVDETGKLDFWELRLGTRIKSVQTLGRMRHKLRFTPDGKQLLIAAETGSSSIWDLAADKQVAELTPPPKRDPKASENDWGALAFDSKGRRLVASKFGRGTWMWSWPERKVLWHESSEIEASLFSDDGSVICSGWHDPIAFLDVETGKVKRTTTVNGMTDIASSPDGRRLVTTHMEEERPEKRTGDWRLRDAATFDVLKEVAGLQYVWCAAFSPSGWLLAVSTDNSIRVYDTPTWQEVARFDGHEGAVRTVFFGPDDKTLVSASTEDGTALVWSLEVAAGREPFDAARFWTDIAGPGPAIRRAVLSAAKHPDEVVRAFRQKWPLPLRSVDAEQIHKLIGALDSKNSTQRETAQADLIALGQKAAFLVESAAKNTKSPEIRNRTKRILERLPQQAECLAEEALELHAVWALELAATPEAIKLLNEWAIDKAQIRLCEEAAAALKRIEQRNSGRNS